MRIRMHNIGPIRDVDIEFRPLTVLVGPNGSGKTTFTTVTYALLLAHTQALDEAFEIVDNPFVRQTKRARGAGFTRAIFDAWEEAFVRRFEFELRRCSAPDLQALGRARRGGRGAGPRIEISTSAWCLPFRLEEDSIELERNHQRYRKPHVTVPPEADFRSARSTVERALLGDLPRRAIYFPAGRSGFVQTHSALSGLMVGALSGGYFQDATVGAIPGATADFMRLVAQSASTTRAPGTSSAAGEIERGLLRGTVRLDDQGPTRQVFFRPEGHTQEWPVQNMATSVAELSPLVLYLRHQARSGDAVLIDEPESHLHPENQVALADALASLSDLLPPVIVATHSEFLVAALSNRLLSARVTSGTDMKEAELPLGVHEFRFKEKDRGVGVVVRSVPINANEGFEVTQFSDVADRVFDDSIALYNRLHVDD